MVLNNGFKVDNRSNFADFSNIRSGFRERRQEESLEKEEEKQKEVEKQGKEFVPRNDWFYGHNHCPVHGD